MDTQQTVSSATKTSVGKEEILATLRKAGTQGCTLSQLMESTGLDSDVILGVTSNLCAAGRVVFVKGYNIFFMKGNVPQELLVH